MDPEADPPKTLSVRHKCSACYKQYKKKEHLIEHMKVSYHSVHQPKCPVCKKHCKSFESVREHLTGPLRKADCSKIFNAQGCDLCLNVFESSDALTLHKELCCFSPPVLLGSSMMSSPDFELESSAVAEENCTGQVLEAVALDCEMVGAGSDGSLDICARVCLVDESEKVIFHAYVRPLLPVTNYRFEITGITEENLRDAMPHKEVQEKVQEILYNGESIWKTRLDGGKARLLVGHGLDHDLDCLRIAYPDHLLRDTAIYRPLMKTNLISHSLKYLARTYLGYEIQTGAHDPYEDCVAAMRLYKRIRTRTHQTEGLVTSDATQYINSVVNIFDSSKLKALMNMAPDDLYKMSRSNYRCWCMDARPVMQS